MFWSFWDRSFRLRHIQYCKWKHFKFFNSATPKCEAFFSKNSTFTYSKLCKVGCILKLNQFCFLPQKVEMRSRFDINQKNSNCALCSKPLRKNVSLLTCRRQRVNNKNVSERSGMPVSSRLYQLLFHWQIPLGLDDMIYKQLSSAGQIFNIWQISSGNK